MVQKKNVPQHRSAKPWIRKPRTQHIAKPKRRFRPNLSKEERAAHVDPFPFCVRHAADWILWFLHDQVSVSDFQDTITQKWFSLQEWLLVCVCVFELVDVSDTESVPAMGKLFGVHMGNDVGLWRRIRQTCDPRQNKALVRKRTFPARPCDQRYNWDQLKSSTRFQERWVAAMNGYTDAEPVPQPVPQPVQQPVLEPIPNTRESQILAHFFFQFDPRGRGLALAPTEIRKPVFACFVRSLQADEKARILTFMAARLGSGTN